VKRGLWKRILFPPKCAACRVLIDWYDGDLGLCEDCIKGWELAKREPCSICGEAVSRCLCMTEEMKRAKCADFRKLTYYYHATRDRVQNRVLYAIKENRTQATHDFLALELLPHLQAVIDGKPNGDFCIVWLPRSREAKKKYDTDQAEQLAYALSRLSGISAVRALKRVGGTVQKDLSANARSKNAKQSFALCESVDLCGKTVILVDDLVTTGSGMAAGARLLRKNGAALVHCIAVASDDLNRELS